MSYQKRDSGRKVINTVISHHAYYSTCIENRTLDLRWTVQNALQMGLRQDGIRPCRLVSYYRSTYYSTATIMILYLCIALCRDSKRASNVRWSLTLFSEGIAVQRTICGCLCSFRWRDMRAKETPATDERPTSVL